MRFYSHVFLAFVLLNKFVVGCMGVLAHSAFSRYLWMFRIMTCISFIPPAEGALNEVVACMGVLSHATLFKGLLIVL